MAMAESVRAVSDRIKGILLRKGLMSFRAGFLPNEMRELSFFSFIFFSWRSDLTKFCSCWCGCRTKLSRRYSFALRAGHKTAFLCTESTMYKYMEDLAAPKQWFKANVNEIMDRYAEEHQITKEDLFLG